MELPFSEKTHLAYAILTVAALGWTRRTNSRDSRLCLLLVSVVTGLLLASGAGYGAVDKLLAGWGHTMAKGVPVSAFLLLPMVVVAGGSYDVTIAFTSVLSAACMVAQFRTVYYYVLSSGLFRLDWSPFLQTCEMKQHYCWAEFWHDLFPPLGADYQPFLVQLVWTWLISFFFVLFESFRYNQSNTGAMYKMFLAAMFGPDTTMGWFTAEHLTWEVRRLKAGLMGQKFVVGEGLKYFYLLLGFASFAHRLCYLSTEEEQDGVTLLRNLLRGNSVAQRVAAGFIGLLLTWGTATVGMVHKQHLPSLQTWVVCGILWYFFSLHLPLGLGIALWYREQLQYNSFTTGYRYNKRPERQSSGNGSAGGKQAQAAKKKQKDQ